MGSGLWSREIGYLRLPSEKALPLPKKLWSGNMDGLEVHRVERVTKELRRLERESIPLFVENGWKPPNEMDWFEEEFKGGFYLPKAVVRGKGASRLLGISRRNAFRFLSRDWRSVFSSVNSKFRGLRSVVLPKGALELSFRSANGNTFVPMKLTGVTCDPPTESGQDVNTPDSLVACGARSLRVVDRHGSLLRSGRCFAPPSCLL